MLHVGPSWAQVVTCLSVQYKLHAVRVYDYSKYHWNWTTEQHSTVEVLTTAFESQYCCVCKFLRVAHWQENHYTARPTSSYWWMSGQPYNFKSCTKGEGRACNAVVDGGSGLQLKSYRPSEMLWEVKLMCCSNAWIISLVNTTAGNLSVGELWQGCCKQSQRVEENFWEQMFHERTEKGSSRKSVQTTLHQRASIQLREH